MNNTIDEITLFEILNILIKRKKTIILYTLIATMLATAYVLLPVFEKEKKYDAVSSISLIYNYKAPENPEEIGEGYVIYQDRLQNIMIPTIKGYAQSLSILRSIISELDLKDHKGQLITAKSLAENVTIENQVDSNLIQITVNYEDEQKAKDIANKIPEKLIQMASANPELKDYKINIIDYAVANEVKESSNKLLIVMGFIIGILMGVFWVFIDNFMKKTVQYESRIRFMGLDIDLTLSIPIDVGIQNKIVALAILSEANRLTIGVHDTDNLILPTEFLQLLTLNDIEANILSYSSYEFLIKSKESDLSLIIVEEEKSIIKDLKELAKLINKYKIKTSVIYIEK